MQVIVNQGLIENAFRDDVNLKKRVFDAISDTPQHVLLFEDLARHAEKLRDRAFSGDSEPSHKRRKLENGDDAKGICLPERNGTVLDPQASQSRDLEVIFEAKDLSFQIPLRKKLHVEFGRHRNRSEEPAPILLLLKNKSTEEIEYEMPADQIEHILKLPLPEKAQKQWNYIVIPSCATNAASETLLFTVNDNALPTTNFGTDTSLNALLRASSSDTVLEKALLFATSSQTLPLIQPDPAEFSSAIPESHRKKETAYHVKAFRGSKDGFLFFLSSMIFFGFKKPLLYFALEAIMSVSYTSVLQRTFNMVIAYEEGEEKKEVEFSMLDQADFAGIDAYVKRHGLADASLADARKAKKLGINKKKKKDEEIDDDGGEEQSELKRAEQEIEEQEVDEEDELEEDYDPGSEGESEGSGSESEEGGEGARDTGGVDLVREELGSEAEEVSEEGLEEAEEVEAEEVDEEAAAEEVDEKVDEEVNEEDAKEQAKWLRARQLEIEEDEQL